MKYLISFVLIVVAVFVNQSCGSKSSNQNKSVCAESFGMLDDTLSQSCGQAKGRQILEALGRKYGNQLRNASFSLESPKCPDFIVGVYFDKDRLVIQVTGDTVKARKELENAAGSKDFSVELTGGTNYSQKQLYAINEELLKKFTDLKDAKVKANISGFGVGLRNIEIRLIVNTPEKRNEFQTKVMNSPAFRFTGPEVPQINGKIGYNDTLGISLRPEYSVYSTKMAKIQFVLYNNSGDRITCGNRYSITYRDEKGVWRELPINDTFEDIGCIVQSGRSRFINASLYPDLHLNRSGRYRFFYEIGFEGDRMTFMTEFRLTDNKKKLEQAVKSVPFYMSPKLTNSSDRIDKKGNRDSIFTPVDIMPEFPGGESQLNKFIEDNMQYPFVSRQNGAQGRVIVMVVIEKDGSIAKCRIMRSVDPNLDEEALRIVKKMPRWKPGKRDGKTVRAQYTFPVMFKLVGN